MKALIVTLARLELMHMRMILRGEQRCGARPAPAHQFYSLAA